MLLIKIEQILLKKIGRITDNIHTRYFDKEYKDLINNLSVYGLREKDLYLTNFANRISLKSVMSRYTVNIIWKYYQWKRH